MNELVTEPSTVSRNFVRGISSACTFTPSAYERDVSGIDLPVVDRHQHQIDVGLRPDGVVRQAAAENDGEDRAILLDLFDQIVERGRELLMNRSAHGL